MNLLNSSSCTDNPDVSFCAYQSEEGNQEYYQYKDSHVINDQVVYQSGDAGQQQTEDCGKVKQHSERILSLVHSLFS